MSIRHATGGTSRWAGRCCIVLVRRGDEAVARLEAGLAEGSWWAEPVLRGDPDLEPIRSTQRFEQLTVQSAEGWKASLAEPDEPPIVVPAEGDVQAALIVLPKSSSAPKTHHDKCLRLDPRRPGGERTQSGLHDERSLEADALAEG